MKLVLKCLQELQNILAFVQIICKFEIDQTGVHLRKTPSNENNDFTAALQGTLNPPMNGVQLQMKKLMQTFDRVLQAKKGS